jgi:hypothetical protein
MRFFANGDFRKHAQVRMRAGVPSEGAPGPWRIALAVRTTCGRLVARHGAVERHGSVFHPTNGGI